MSESLPSTERQSYVQGEADKLFESILTLTTGHCLPSDSRLGNISIGVDPDSGSAYYRKLSHDITGFVNLPINPRHQEVSVAITEATDDMGGWTMIRHLILTAIEGQVAKMTTNTRGIYGGDSRPVRFSFQEGEGLPGELAATMSRLAFLNVLAGNTEGNGRGPLLKILEELAAPKESESRSEEG